MESEKTTSAGKWSVALAVIPVGIALSFLLLIMIPVWTGHVHGEGGWGVMLALYGLLYYGSWALAVTSLLGAAMGIFAICKTKWQKGITGLLLNLSILLLAGSFLAVTYHKWAIDPHRLPIAAYHGEYEKVKKLVSKGFDINYQSGNDTALSNAANRGEEQIADFLLSHGADVNIRNPLEKAVNRDNYKIVKMLLEHGANPNCLPTRNAKIAQLLLEYKADVNHKDQNGRTPLHRAVTGSEEVVKLLISYGADVNAKDSRGEMPLHILAGYWPQDWWTPNFRENVTDMLLVAGADIEAKTRDGRTPLYAAAVGARPVESVRMLLERGANPENIKDVYVKFIAVPVSLSKLELESWVRVNISDVNVKNPEGQSLLHSAVKGDNKNLNEILLEMGADVNAQDKDGNTPLHLAVQDPDIEVIQLFIANKADVNIQNKKGQTPLHILTKSRTRVEENLPYQIQIQACELLLMNGANVDIKDKDGKSPLEWQRSLLPSTESGRQYQKELIRLMQKYQNN